MRRPAACYAAIAGVSIAGSAYAQPQRVIVPPKLTTFVEAEFPPSEVKAGKGATVLLQIAIDATGKVAAVAVVESAGPAFDLAAVAAAKQFVFTPATVDGTPIPVKIAYRYAVHLHGEARQEADRRLRRGGPRSPHQAADGERAHRRSTPARRR